MTNLAFQIFQNHEIRFVGTADRPEWVAADILAILYPEADPRNYSNYLGKVQTEWKNHKPIMTPGGTQSMTTIYEPGFYVLISRSNSPIMVPFQKWMFEEVMPAIRRDGFYVNPSIAVDTEPFAVDQHLSSVESFQRLGDVAIKVAGGPGSEASLIFYAMITGSQPKAKPAKKVLKPKQPHKKALYIPGWAEIKPRGKWTDNDVMQYVRLRNEVEPLTVDDAYRLSRTHQRQKIGVHRLAAAIRSL